MSKYKELYPQSLSDGVGLISTLSSLEVPWAAMNIPAIERMYGVRSGFKTIVDSFIEVPAELRASVVFAMFNEKWTKLWNIYKLEYNPLSAYKVVETGENSVEKQFSDVHEYGKTQNEVSDDTGTLTDASTSESSTNAGLYGFNSNTSVPSDTSAASASENSTETRDLNITRTRTDGGSDTIDREDREVGEHNITKEGNIGYSTPQKLLREEFELWATPFFQKVFDDIDSFITIMVY